MRVSLFARALGILNFFVFFMARLLVQCFTPWRREEVLSVEESHEGFTCRSGVDAHEQDDEHEHCGGFHLGEPQDPVGESDADAGHEQATDYDPECHHCLALLY